VFTRDEMIAAFDVTDVNPSPARFDQKKADSINADHIRLLSEEDFGQRILPYLIAGGALPVEPNEAQLATVQAAVPLVQSRVTVLSEVVGMMGFLFTSADALEYQDDALKSLGADSTQVLEASIAALEALGEGDWQTEPIQAALQGALIDGLGLKPRVAFGALRVAASGRRVSPPLFESFELLGRDETIARLRRLAAHLAA
jgi:glutamyl-tRNA synthetase